MSHSKLIISLDFELHWGRFDKYQIEDYQEYYKNTKSVIPLILDLFYKKKIHATWATVGMLMAKDWEEWEYYTPEILPSFKEERYSAYNWSGKRKAKEINGLFASDIVSEILKCPGQELGSHTFSHYYTGMMGSDQDAFASDLGSAKKIAFEKFGIDLKSLVFPRNQYNDNYLEKAAEAGFKYIRTNPKDWFWDDTAQESLIKKVFRTGDTLIALGKNTTYPLGNIESNGLLYLPASRLLRPYKSNSFFNGLRLSRIKEELEFAAKNGLIYHLWWHPHNFGFLPEENLEVLGEIIDFVSILRDTFGMESYCMREIGEMKSKSFIQQGIR
jgi:hypothetical protein